jgi:hypothetical protein
MKRSISNRRGFNEAHEPLIVLTLLGMAIALALPMLQCLTSAGWTWWSATLIVLATFLVLIAYLLAAFYCVFTLARLIAKLLKRLSASSEPWCALVAGLTTLFIALPAFLILAAIVVKRLVPK